MGRKFGKGFSLVHWWIGECNAKFNFANICAIFVSSSVGGIWKWHMNTEIWTAYHKVLPRKPYYSSHGRIRNVFGGVGRFEECSTLNNFNKAGFRM